MHRATPLPAELLDRPFTVSRGLELGLTRKRLRSGDLWMPYRGVRVPRVLGWNPELRARAGLLVCPRDTLVVGFDALAVAGLPLPLSEEVLLGRRLAVCPPATTDAYENDQFAVRWPAVSLLLPRVLDAGVLRLDDADLWLQEVLRHRHQLTPGYRARLGRAVVERVGGDRRVLEAAVERLGSSLRSTGRHLVDEAFVALSAEPSA